MQEEPNQIDIQQEAKEIILKELEDKGVINYMRAKIKKSIIDIISHQSESVQQKLDFDYMTPLHRLNKPKEIVLVCQLIKEFLKFYELEYTLPIFENESNVKEDINKEKAKELLECTFKPKINGINIKCFKNNSHKKSKILDNSEKNQIWKNSNSNIYIYRNINKLEENKINNHEIKKSKRPNTTKL